MMEFKTYTFKEAIKLLSGKGRVWVEARILFDDMTWLEVVKSDLLFEMKRTDPGTKIDVAETDGGWCVSYNID